MQCAGKLLVPRFAALPCVLRAITPAGVVCNRTLQGRNNIHRSTPCPRHRISIELFILLNDFQKPAAPHIHRSTKSFIHHASRLIPCVCVRASWDLTDEQTHMRSADGISLSSPRVNVRFGHCPCLPDVSSHSLVSVGMAERTAKGRLHAPGGSNIRSSSEGAHTSHDSRTQTGFISFPRRRPRVARSRRALASALASGRRGRDRVQACWTRWERPMQRAAASNREQRSISKHTLSPSYTSSRPGHH